MSSGHQFSVIYRFGFFEAAPQTGELQRNGVRVKLQEQPFQLLVFLLENAGEIVSRESVRQRLWPGNTFVDFDASLSVAVGKLRDALSDSADNPRFIETIPRRGYRFVAPVEVVSPQIGAHSNVADQSSREAARRAPNISWGSSWGFRIAGIAAIVLVALGIARVLVPRWFQKHSP